VGLVGIFSHFTEVKCSERHITEVKECHLTQSEVAKGFSTYYFG